MAALFQRGAFDAAAAERAGARARRLCGRPAGGGADPLRGGELLCPLRHDDARSSPRSPRSASTSLLKLVLMGPLGVVGLALATALGAWVNLVLLSVPRLSARLDGAERRPRRSSAWRSSSRARCSRGSRCSRARRSRRAPPPSRPGASEALLGALGAAGAALYGAVLLALLSSSVACARLTACSRPRPTVTARTRAGWPETGTWATMPPLPLASRGRRPCGARRRHGDRALRLHADPARHGRGAPFDQGRGRADRLRQFRRLPRRRPLAATPGRRARAEDGSSAGWR